MNIPDFKDNIFNASYPCISYKKRACIYRIGEPTWGIYRVKKGRVKLWKESTELNRRKIFYLVYPNEFFGILDFFNDPRTRRMEATALDKEVVLEFIPFSEFENHLFNNRDMMLSFIHILIEKTGIHWEKYEELLKGKKITMVESGLKTLALQRGTRTPEGVLLKSMTHEELGEYIGANRQFITTTLNNYRSEGKIEYNRQEILFKNI